MKRDLTNNMLFGVCAGMGDELGVDPTLIRLVFVVLTLMGFGLPIIVYLVAALLMQSE
jgi:phage shock protein C